MNIKFKNAGADFYIPSGNLCDLEKIDHLAICAHQDDAEIMAFQGIKACLPPSNKKFMAVVVTDGAGSARSGEYAGVTNDEMIAIRRAEQRKAADIGRYGACLQLNYKSSVIKTKNADFESDILTLFTKISPKIVYIHNIFDKHATHVAVFLNTINALKTLPKDKRPEKIYACEVWRGLDWLPDDKKVYFDVTHKNDELITELLGAFKSQVVGGKRYDLATIGRWLANATYSRSHEVDDAKRVALGMDLTNLIYLNGDILEYANGILSDFSKGILDNLGGNIWQ